MRPGLGSPPTWLRARSLLSWLRARIPEGHPLPEAAWLRRHRGIVVLLWIHVVGLAVFGILTGADLLHTLFEAGIVAVMALLSGFMRWGRRFAEITACLGLLTSSGLLVHFSGGYIEMHFHFFVMVGLMALYQDWVPFLLAIGYVVVHHGLVGVLEPMSVFNHEAAWTHPWRWAALHGVFILAMSVVSLIAWRLAEAAHVRGELILHSAGDGIIGVDAEGRTTFANAAAAAMTGWSVEELIGRPVHALLLAPDEAAPWRAPVELTKREGEVILRRKSGGTFPAQFVSTPIEERGGVVGAVLVFSDITQRRRAEAAVRDSERRYRLLAENISDVIWIRDMNLRPVYISPSVARLRGYTVEEAMTQSLAETLTPASVALAVKALGHAVAADGRGEADPELSLTLDLETLCKDGSTVWTETTMTFMRDQDGRADGIIGVSRNIAERRRAAEALRQTEHQLRQVQKMDAVGRLAGGIAHDFNNLLTVILGRTDLLRRRVEGDRARRDLELITATAGRAGSLTRQLLAFSRNQLLQPKVMDLNTVVPRMADMLRRLIGEHIRLVTVLQPNLGAVRADPTQIEQVIVNLVVNARDAMPGGGVLTIETADARVDDITEAHELSPGPLVSLVVRDTGCGMDASVQAHLFEPFFTTKEPGKGTGLGLATVYGIVKQHDGAIFAESAPGQGATFRIYLPRVADAAVAETDDREPPGPGTETILLVEDEAEVRDLADEILRGHGYTVLAAGPEDALTVSERHAGTIDLLLTDVVMPRMNGRDLADRVTQLRPRTKILFMSGYTDDAILHHGVLEENGRLLAKPFRAADLLRKVREILDR
jgi:PAS domain S-box-containing protein